MTGLDKLKVFGKSNLEMQLASNTEETRQKAMACINQTNVFLVIGFFKGSWGDRVVASIHGSALSREHQELACKAIEGFEEDIWKKLGKPQV
jgi:hypothetical protein